jgi:hypothetical protein
MENKQTPVEFLIENLKNVLTKSQFNDVVIQDIFEQAKTMDNKPKMIEDDVEKLAEEEYPIFDGGLLSIAYNQKHSRIDFIKGYNKAKETLYTEEQIKEAIEKGLYWGTFASLIDDKIFINKFFKLLKETK